MYSFTVTRNAYVSSKFRAVVERREERGASKIARGVDVRVAVPARASCRALVVARGEVKASICSFDQLLHARFHPALRFASFRSSARSTSSIAPRIPAHPLGSSRSEV